MFKETTNQMKESLRTVKYKEPMSVADLMINQTILKKRLKERRHNSRQKRRDRLTLNKIEEQLKR